MKQIRGNLSKIMVLLGLVNILCFSGCAPKSVGKTESTMEILNSYNKKPLPDGFYWNFGIGSNYTEAMKDAVSSLKFMRPVSVNLDVMTTSMKSSKYQDGKLVWTSHEPEKIVHIEPYNVYSSNSRCKVVENWDIPNGILIVRKCPDLQWFKDNDIQFDKIGSF